MKILFLPDVQARPGDNFAFLSRIGKYIAEKRPDRIVCAGDFSDMESLSSYDKGKRIFEGRRYVKDCDAAKRANEALIGPIARAAGYSPDMHLTLGNHEDRIDRAANDNAEFSGLISIADLEYESFGWKVHQFLKPLTLNGVTFAHYFTSGIMGRPITTAAALLTKKHQSCLAGHQQSRQVAYGTRGDGSQIIGIIAGSCYERHEKYLGPQGNAHWRGFLMMHEVKDGEFSECWVTLDYLKRKYK